MKLYSVFRFYENRPGRYLVRDGLTLKEARKHCRDKESSSRTCTSNDERPEYGNWFDGYEPE